VIPFYYVTFLVPIPLRQKVTVPVPQHWSLILVLRQVRKACNEAVAGFMKQLGYEAMRKAADKLSAVSKTTLMPLLGKH
jgi:hypothetical protein